MYITLTCRLCKTEHTLNVTQQQLNRHANGELVQNVFPHLTTDERELLVSRICGKCFDEMYGDIE